MKKNFLGKTGIEVTDLCFGVLPIGPLQKDIDIEEGSDVIALALEKGVNFLDTAQMYKTYPHIKRAIEKTGIRPVITSKSDASTYETMENAILEALDGMSIDYVDIFLLHAAKVDLDVFEVRSGALQCLLDYKKKGILKAIGIATHNVKVVESAAIRDDLDVVFPIINKAGRGILNGTTEEMTNAISLCAENGKGTYLMKVLGGGTLIDDYSSAMNFGREIEGASSIAVGMVSKEEVIYNVAFFNNEKDLEGIISTRNKKSPRVLQNQCKSCGSCITACHSDAITFNEEEKATIDLDKCVQCGYCMAACPVFCIRIV